MNRIPRIENARPLQLRSRILAAPEVFHGASPKTRRVSRDYQGPSTGQDKETASQPDTNPLGWTMVALWLFVAICFAALAISVYWIWMKCGGDSPFQPVHPGAAARFAISHV